MDQSGLKLQHLYEHLTWRHGDDRVEILSFQIEQSIWHGVTEGRVQVQYSNGLKADYLLHDFLNAYEPIIRRTLWERLLD